MVKTLKRSGRLTLMMDEVNRNFMEMALRVYFVVNAASLPAHQYFLTLETLLAFQRRTYRGYVKFTRSQFCLVTSDEVLQHLDEPTRILVQSELKYENGEVHFPLPHPDVALSYYYGAMEYE